MDGASIYFNGSLSLEWQITLRGQDCRLEFIHCRPGQRLSITFKQDSAGHRTVIWPSGFEFLSPAAPVLQKAAHASDTFHFVYDGCRFKQLPPPRPWSQMLAAGLWSLLTTSGPRPQSPS